MSPQKKIKFILFAAILHGVVCYYATHLHIGGAALFEIESVAHSLSGTASESPIQQRPVLVGERFMYRVFNLPLSLVFKGTPRSVKGGYTFFDFSLRMRVLNSLMAGVFIYLLIEASSRFTRLMRGVDAPSSPRDESSLMAPIASRLTPQKLVRIALFPIFGKIDAPGMERSIKSEMVFVYCVLSVAGIGLEQVFATYVVADLPPPTFLLLMRWVLHTPMSFMLPQKAFSDNLLLILLNSLICAISIGVFRWWRSSAKRRCN